jgi:hypothetical protein
LISDDKTWIFAWYRQRITQSDPQRVQRRHDGLVMLLPESEQWVGIMLKVYRLDGIDAAFQRRPRIQARGYQVEIILYGTAAQHNTTDAHQIG